MSVHNSLNLVQLLLLIHLSSIPTETRKNKNFGTSLLLANRPMSPKIINGSFAAIFDNDDVLFDLARKISQFRYGDDDCPGEHNFYSFDIFVLIFFKNNLSFYSDPTPHPWDVDERQTIVSRLKDRSGPAFGH
jgi:hypothetical protein